MSKGEAYGNVTRCQSRVELDSKPPNTKITFHPPPPPPPPPPPQSLLTTTQKLFLPPPSLPSSTFFLHSIPLPLPAAPDHSNR
ncbi:hypothetical protein BC936DRAFT_138484 [Jimgerdemannia flammicorona]|uniref:Uncharacterized protein n=2 Tax=Jimgerdemannia flammicorona TaxID=994334 RepID=A0A433CC66_9FUNG|nr:hypothetical protein BC936DRAFT_138484 [Jimgerdemannia flammicorona]RUS32795.1 hypothetical protein BC938DRAFT_474252 [Jimgerdemannia flammicorona]